MKIKENKDNGCNLVIYLDLAKIDKYQNMDPKGHGEQQSQAQAENELKGALRRYKVRHWKSLSVWTFGCWPLTLSHFSHPNFTVFKLDTEASQSCATSIK